MKREFKIISDLLPNNSRVLDVGCGDGTLMKFLSKEKNIDVRGLELNEENVNTCISKGLSVIEGNAENDLGQFPDKSFDFVILSQTLQAFYNPVTVLDQLLRVGKASIVSIPNFGYWRVRAKLLFFGRMPETKSLPYKWYDTPNLHMCTIKDFYELCKNRNIKMKKIVGINDDKTSLINNNNIKFKNLFSEVGIFLIS
jgi:methionine biosynthesis protein MetW|tara:strand:- start:474 stop:1067 length:594 start_codon:yes stop_codon:yes gene_type:complete